MNDEILQEFYDLVYEQAVEDTMEEYLEEAAVLSAASVATGAGLGYLSAKRAHKKRKETLKKLEEKIKNVKDPKIKRKIEDDIETLKAQIKLHNPVRRAAGGAVTGPLGVGAYHLYDRRKRKKMEKHANKRSK